MKMPSLHFNRLFLVALTASIIFAIISAVPQTSAQDNIMSYQIANPDDGSYTYTLNVAIPQSLIEYYQGLSHLCWLDFNYPKFVTPYAVQPIADCLRQIYVDDEAFTNQVLTLVHQIPYEVTAPVYYPAETLAMNKGDCDLFSLIAASILKAGGIDVVLFRYINEPHMNIGVHLTQTPQNTRTPVFSAKYENITYYIAECTSTDWQNGWRVGECPKSLQNASVAVINTTKCEQTAPIQIVATIENINPISPPVPIPPTFTPTPSPDSFSLPPDPTFTPTPTPVIPSPHPDKTPTPNPTKTPSPTPTATSSPSLTPNPTQKPIQTAPPSATLTPAPTPASATDTIYDPAPTCTPTSMPTATVEPTNPLTNTPQPIQQQAQTTNTLYTVTVTGVIITIITAAVLLKKTKQLS
jgi:hypothetical protein